MMTDHHARTWAHMPRPAQPKHIKAIRAVAIVAIVVGVVAFAAAIIGLAVDKAAFDAEKYEVYINGY